MSEMKNFTERNIYQTKVKCPSCGKEEDFEIHALIDTTKDVNAENKIFQSSYFSHVCSQCGTVQPISYSCMYHDSSKKLLIGFADSDSDYAEMKETLSGTKQDTKLDEVLSKWLETCTVRLVKSEYELQEKVLIQHFDLDDRVIEIARKKILDELKASNKNVEALLFNTQDNSYLFMILTEEGIESSIMFSEDAYHEIEQEYKDILKDDKSIEINQEWANNIIKS